MRVCKNGILLNKVFLLLNLRNGSFKEASVYLWRYIHTKSFQTSP